MNACEAFCEDLARVVLSPQPQPVILGEVSQRLRRVLAAEATDVEIDTTGFDPSLLDRHNRFQFTRTHHADQRCPGEHRKKGDICPTTGLPCMTEVSSLATFEAGRAIGRAISKAFRGELGRIALTKEFYHILGHAQQG